MLTEKQTTQISKFMSLVLRHKPETIGLTLDENGWADTYELLQKLRLAGEPITMDMLEYVVENNSKKRFAFSPDKSKIRASQGHSVEVELAYQPMTPPDVLYHGTADRFVESILHTGLEKRNRHHVHLSRDRDTALAVGKRHGRPVILEVDATAMLRDGHTFFCSENGVWLTDHVPVKYIKNN